MSFLTDRDIHGLGAHISGNDGGINGVREGSSGYRLMKRDYAIQILVQYIEQRKGAKSVILRKTSVSGKAKLAQAISEGTV